MNEMSSWITTYLDQRQTAETACDGSSVLLLARTMWASLVHCTLPPGSISATTVNRGIDEVWYFLSGSGELWRSNSNLSLDINPPVPVSPGTTVSIPRDTIFQFRSDLSGPLVFICHTTPPWPGPESNELASDGWFGEMAIGSSP